MTIPIGYSHHSATKFHAVIIIIIIRIILLAGLPCRAMGLQLLSSSFVPSVPRQCNNILSRRQGRHHHHHHHHRNTRRSFVSRSFLVMMPEGPEVRTVVDQLQGAVHSRRLVDIEFLSGRYAPPNPPPPGFREFRDTLGMIPRSSASSSASTSTTLDDNRNVIQAWNCKGKFMYIILDDGYRPPPPPPPPPPPRETKTGTTTLQEDEEESSSTTSQQLITNNADDDDDYQRSIWITLGMTGKFVNEQLHNHTILLQQSKNKNKNGNKEDTGARWCLVLDPVPPGDDDPFATTTTTTTKAQQQQRRRVYYYDTRSFGTLHFCLSRRRLLEKLQSLGPDILQSTTTTTTLQDFTAILAATKPTVNICRFLMNQGKLSGVGNYILAEALYRAKIDPFATLGELKTEQQQRVLFQELQAVARESYESQRVTMEPSADNNNNNNNNNNKLPQPVPKEFEMQCYGRTTCVKGNTVIRHFNGPHGRTIWYTEEQLFMSLQERWNTTSTSLLESSESISSSQSEKESGDDNVAAVVDRIVDATDDAGDDKKSSAAPNNVDTVSPVDRLLRGLVEPSWKSRLGDACQTPSFANLAQFLESEREKGVTIYPPEEKIFAVLNACPFDQIKVVIVGQDPYHGPNQGHGLAFSVQKGVPIPPSLRNIIREAMDDVGIEAPTHGNLEHWAKQGVLLLNTVLTVRRGEANSHANKGWEEFTDACIQALNDDAQDGLVFLLWGNPAAKKASSVDAEKHVIIRTSHPSPLGATKTASPFIGSHCFRRANEALTQQGKPKIDWSIL